MKRSLFLTLAFCVIVALSLVAGFTANQLLAREPLPSVELEHDSKPLDRKNKHRIVSYADMLDQVTPAVVSVHVAHITQSQSGQRSMENMLRRYYGMPPLPDQDPREYVEHGLGSGFVVTADGYVLTNNHVVAGHRGRQANEIIVQFNDGREYEAIVVGTDPQTDVAVLKIQADGQAFPHLPIGDSRQLRVGDIVFAVGNPLRVGLTVTQGIVSALERTDLGIISGRNMPALESFIQTDAAINQGNSGGPLIDAEGRVIGINTAIASPSGGSIGIGFAIPINLAAKIMHSLVDEGEVRRGFIGVELASLDRELAQAFGLASARGALINSVTPGLPAERAGLTHGDVVTTVNGQQVDSVRELIYLISSQSPGTTVTLGIVRGGETQEIDVTLGDREKILGGEGWIPPAESDEPPTPQLAELVEGIKVAPVDPATREADGLPEDVQGLRVVEVNDDSPYRAILPPGSIIQSINNQPVKTVEQAESLIKTDKPNALRVFVNGRYQYLPLIVDEDDG